MSFFNPFKARAEAYATITSRRKILRDYLAIDRTILSNQNTFLAYIRTALTLFVAGATFIKFFKVLTFEIIGWAFMPIGVIVAITGLVRYIRLRRILKNVWGTHHVPPPEPQNMFEE